MEKQVGHKIHKERKNLTGLRVSWNTGFESLIKSLNREHEEPAEKAMPGNTVLSWPEAS